MVKNIKSQAELEREFIKAGDKAVIVDFHATWCGPCKDISPKVVEMSKKYPNVIVLKVDVDECEDIATKYRINSMPTFKVFVRGQEVKGDAISGASESRLERVFMKYN